MSRRIAALCCFILLAAAAFAQSAERVLSSMSDLERRTLALDIAVSTYYELRDRAAAYGIAAEGSSEELRSRIYAFLGIEPPAAPAPASSITIESASSLEYFTLDGSSDKVIRLTGPITMSVRTEDGFVHKVSADSIDFNRDRNIVEASGNVTYLREGAGRSDEFKGSTILVDLNSYAGVFLDCAYNLEPTAALQRSLSFKFEKLTRRGSELSILEKAKVTACDDPEPHYHIRARKVWLFENGDWALSGATLYIGVVPVLWFPFFYYPSDEVLFHPVIGYRSREGAFVQTTTYLIGERQKDAKASSSLSLFSQQASGGTTERSGIFIRHIQKEDAKGQAGASAQASAQSAASEPSPRTSLKLLADVYSALGAYLGIQGGYPAAKTGSLAFSLGIGLSRSLFLESSGYYSPFDYANDYASVWNSSNFLGLNLPTRFGMSLSYSYKKTASPLRYGITLDLPLYSDPYFEQDFTQRAESSSILSTFDANTTVVSKRTTMTQSLLANASWAPQGTRRAPILANATLSRLAAQMSWKTKSQPTTGLTAAQRRLLAVDPQRDFFYPDTFKPLDAAFSLAGTLVSYDSAMKKAKTAADGQNPAPAAPAAESGSEDAVAADATEAGAKAQRDYSQWSANLGWSAAGSANVEDKFYPSAWTYPEDVDGTLSYLLIGGKAAAKLSSSVDWAQRLISMQTGLGFSAQNQWRPRLYDDRTSPTTVHPYRLADYAYKAASLAANADLILSPFNDASPLAASNLKYSIGGMIYGYAYSGLSDGTMNATPLYDSTWIGWDSDTITTHSVAATLALAPRGKATQSLAFIAYLPPLLDTYSATYTFNQKYLRASLAGAISKASSGAELLPSTLTANLALGASPYPVARSSFSWDFESSAPLSSVTSLEYGWAKAAFTAKKSKGYAFSSGLWSIDGTEYFRPYEASLSFAPIIGKAAAAAAAQTGADAKANAKKESGETETAVPEEETSETASQEVQAEAKVESGVRLSLKPTLSYTQNLVRFTESTLGASVSLSLTSAQGTSLSFSSSSANKSAWRYWTSLFPATASFDPSDYSRDFFTDLIDSFSIWDTTKLKSTLFKLQSLSLKLSQDLHDWSLEASLGMSPVLVTPDSGRPYYQLDFSFSLGVTWKDIPEIKTALAYDEGSFSL
jgi:lipopolysaccharide assembly outer membrane protein LptD (OstA)